MKESEKKQEIIDIDLQSILRFIKRHFLTCLLIGIIGGIVGYIISFTFDKMYSSEMTVLPESNTSQLGGLSAIFGLSKLNEAGEAVRPDLYPNILSTSLFALHLLKQPVSDIDGNEYKSLRAFVDSTTEINVETKKKGFFQSLFSGNSNEVKADSSYLTLDSTLFVPSKKDRLYIKFVLSSISSKFELRSGIVNISAEASDPLVAAKLASLSGEYLLNFVTDYRSQKSSGQAHFLRDQMESAKRRANKAELALQRHKDSHRNLFLNEDRVEEQRLATEFQLARNMFLDLNRQLDEAVLILKKDRPVFKVLEPAKVELRTIAPRRLWIAAGLAILANVVYLSIVLLFTYGWWNKFKNI